jgi:NADPH2:quinone reductase
VYLYGSLDSTPTELSRSFGMAWGVGGWLVFPFLQKVGPAVAEAMKQRVARELTTTFASRYAGELSLAGMLQPEAMARYGQRATGMKFLVNPNKVL